MSASRNGPVSSIIKVVTGGFLGTVFTTLVMANSDYHREQREALQNLVIVWHSSYIGAHRDAITDWLLSPAGTELRGLSETEYRAKLTELFDKNEAPNTAILAVTGFFRTVDVCIRDERCDKDRTHAAFSADAWEFYGLFGPLLRFLDCERGYSGVEDPLLSVIRRSNDVPSGPDRCTKS